MHEVRLLFVVSISKIKKSPKAKILLLVSVLVLVAAVVLLPVRYYYTGFSDKYDVFDLKKVGSVENFLAELGLTYESQESVREITLPSEDDKVFAEYLGFQRKQGMDMGRFSGKKVEERYLRLKNKDRKNKSLYAVLYIYKEKVIGGHLTTLEQGVPLMPLGGE